MTYKVFIGSKVWKKHYRKHGRFNDSGYKSKRFRKKCTVTVMVTANSYISCSFYFTSKSPVTSKTAITVTMNYYGDKKNEITSLMA